PFASPPNVTRRIRWPRFGSPHPDSAPDTSARPEAGCRIPAVRSAMPLSVGGVRTGGEGPVRGRGTALERPQGAGVGDDVDTTGGHTQATAHPRRPLTRT